MDILRYSLETLHNFLIVLIFAGILLSWFPRARWHPIGRMVNLLSEPLLEPFRRMIPPIKMGNGVSLDLSPVACLVVIQVVFRLISLTLR